MTTDDLDITPAEMEGPEVTSSKVDQAKSAALTAGRFTKGGLDAAIKQARKVASDERVQAVADKAPSPKKYGPAVLVLVLLLVWRARKSRRG